MIKKVINFFNRHRLVLILGILLVIVVVFLGVNTFLFFHHDFAALSCTSDLDEETCYHEDIVIFINPEESKENFFLKYDDEIEMLKEDYNLDEFNFYTAYYYLVAARLNYDTKEEYKILTTFFEKYANTYNLEEFYMEINFYFNLFYADKIS